VLFGVGGAVNNYYASQKAAAKQATDQAEIKGLKTAVETANKNQEANTKVFVGAFAKLSKDVGDLQTQVSTEKLQTKLAGVQTELQKTQKALVPGPKAELVFSFAPLPQSAPGEPIALVTDKMSPLNADGSVHVEFLIVNATDVDAVSAEINFQICTGCKFAKEPDGLNKLPGLRDNQRYVYLPDLLAKEANRVLSVDVIPPPFVGAFDVGFEYRCHTCIIPKQVVSGTVHILR
jgi:hypothetical protein